MTCRVTALCVVAAGVFGLVPTHAASQSFDSVGGRALGMAGAFVAVADDPSAAWWNPAGLASGQPAGATIEWLRAGRHDLSQSPVPGLWRRTARFASLGTWPVGLSFVDIDESRVTSDPAGALRGTRLTTRHYAASVLQTVAEGVVVGTTLRYVRGSVASVAVPVTPTTTDAVFDALARADARTQGALDVDVSTMVDLGRVRVGGMMRNLRTPTFTDSAGIAITVPREVRAGVSARVTDGLTFALDVDVEPIARASGRSQVVAFGAERTLTPRATARAGVRRNLVGDQAWVGAAGVSVAVRPGAWLDGHLTWGRTPAERGFGVAVRAGW